MSTKNTNPVDSVPPTEPVESPQVASTATATAAMPAPKRVARGADLVPDLSKHKAGISTSYWYWIGGLPGLPVENVAIGGETFPKMEERVIVTGTETHRSGVIGALVRLTPEKVKRIREALPRTIIRFTEAKGVFARGTGERVDVVMGEPTRRKGFPITIRPEAECIERAKNNFGVDAYEARPHDEPAADYLFAALCVDQSRPTRGEYYPDPLSTTGLEWPGSLKD